MREVYERGRKPTVLVPQKEGEEWRQRLRGVPSTCDELEQSKEEVNKLKAALAANQELVVNLTAKLQESEQKSYLVSKNL